MESEPKSPAEPLVPPPAAPAAPPSGDKTRPKLLKLKSVNGANLSMQGILPQDETPTPTKFLRSCKDIFRAIDDQQNAQTDAKTDNNKGFSENPFDQSFKKSMTPEPKQIEAAVEPNAEKDHIEIPQADEVMDDDSMSNPAANVGSEVTVNSENDESQNSRETKQDPQNPFKRPTDLPVPKMSDQIVVTSALTPVTATTATTATASTSVNMVQTTPQVPMLVLANGANGLTQMAQPIASPTRLVMAPEMFNGQNGQGKYLVLQQPTPRVIAGGNILVPSSTSGTPMILTSPMSALGGQFIVASPQVMQIQDPQTGAISQVITQSPQQQMPQFVMAQQMPDQMNQRNTTQQTNSQNTPPTYQQVMMAVSPQIQFVTPQQFQMVPTNQSMLVNQNGNQVQIINHGSIANSNQIQLQAAPVNNGQQTTVPQVTTTQTRPAVTTEVIDPKNLNNSSLEENGAISLVGHDSVGSIGSDDGEDTPSRRSGYSRPSYTHRPSQIGLNNVVQLSKESLQAIEQAGVECGAGKRGGPRLDYEQLDPKRRRFLERNRQAAARCRERKKQWIVSLEGRANELKAENQQVEDDIIRLKSKLDQLRGALDMQRQRHANGIDREVDRENNIHPSGSSVTEMPPKSLNLNPHAADDVVPSTIALKTETSMGDS